MLSGNAIILRFDEILYSMQTPNMYHNGLKIRLRWQRLAFLLVLASLLGTWPLEKSTAQADPSAIKWSEPIMLSNPTVDAWPPSMATDSAGNIHVIWSQTMTADPPPGEGDTLFYTRFDGNSWTKPTDIIVSPIGSTEWSDITTSPDGMVHVIWGTGGEDSRLMYAHAPACCAEDIQQWSKPIIIYMPILQSPVIVADQQGHLHIAYASRESHSIIYQRSDDGGKTWNPQVTLPSGTRQSDEEPIWPRLSVDGKGRVHLVWSVIPWPGRTVLYARSEDGGNTWDDPIIIDSNSRPDYRPDYGPIVLNIAAFGDGEIHMMWDGAPTVERNHIWSSDGGANWTQPEIVFPEVSRTGRSGYNHMVKDSNGILHAVSIHPVDPARHSTWDGNNWSNSTEIPTLGPIEQPKLVITRGNTLHLVWTTKMAHPYTNWYVQGQINAPESPIQPLPPLIEPTTTVDIIPAALTPTANALQIPPSELEKIKSPSNPAEGIIVGAILAALLVGGVLALYINLSAKQKK
jgi:hypothetical protein